MPYLFSNSWKRNYPLNWPVSLSIVGQLRGDCTVIPFRCKLLAAKSGIARFRGTRPTRGTGQVSSAATFVGKKSKCAREKEEREREGERERERKKAIWRGTMLGSPATVFISRAKPIRKSKICKSKPVSVSDRRSFSAILIIHLRAFDVLKAESERYGFQ